MPAPSTKAAKRNPSAAKIVAGCLPAHPPVACSMSRNDHPSRPRAMTCSRFSLLKTLLITTEATCPCSSYVLSHLPMAAFHLIIYGRFWVITEDPGRRPSHPDNVFTADSNNYVTWDRGLNNFSLMVNFW